MIVWEKIEWTFQPPPDTGWFCVAPRTRSKRKAGGSHPPEPYEIVLIEHTRRGPVMSRAGRSRRRQKITMGAVRFGPKVAEIALCNRIENTERVVRPES